MGGCLGERDRCIDGIKGDDDGRLLTKNSIVSIKLLLNLLSATITDNCVVQILHAGVSESGGCGSQPAKFPGERRNTFADAIRLASQSGKTHQLEHRASVIHTALGRRTVERTRTVRDQTRLGVRPIAATEDVQRALGPGAAGCRWRRELEDHATAQSAIAARIAT